MASFIINSNTRIVFHLQHLLWILLAFTTSLLFAFLIYCFLISWWWTQIWCQDDAWETAEQTSRFCWRFDWKKPVGIASLHAVFCSFGQERGLWSQWKPHNETQGLLSFQVCRLQLHGRILQSSVSCIAEPAPSQVSSKDQNYLEIGWNGLDVVKVERRGSTRLQHRTLVEFREDCERVIIS